MTKLFALLAAIGVAFAAPAFAVEANKDHSAPVAEKAEKAEKDAKDAKIAPAAGEVSSEKKEEMKKEEMKK